ncbi:cobalt ABC transporter ATP-binding protein [Thiocapsa imhoffii]|uniref:ABC transporter ATP-binding protein n=1 Tax=Thiocapsa imhoffii TaxID=382777 RepID=A0A9X0WJZ5_9GAMM|nr:ABC transporter ATP-binding protein [Thiocapsa imhoffii]MBK1646109.1 cobalt ABC transporter ATP-binding protein [Thiocapsa imhoffii]
MITPILEARGLCFRYASGALALRDLNLRIERGRRLVLLGANGCGKTTLLLHLNGTLQPQEGVLQLDGQAMNYGRRTRQAWRRRVGLVLQEPDDQLFAATVYQDVSFGPLNQGLGETAVHERVMETLAMLDITDLAQRPTHVLSFGQKKRVALAGVLAMHPEVLILDEPDAGLDGTGIARLFETLAGLGSQGTTLIMATHDVDLAYAWADDAAILAAGRVLRQGNAADLFGDAQLLAAAGLAMPPVLAVAHALRPTHPWPDEQPPRTTHDLITMITAGTAP